jgi:hypothetical protein
MDALTIVHLNVGMEAVLKLKINVPLKDHANKVYCAQMEAAVNLKNHAPMK